MFRCTLFVVVFSRWNNEQPREVVPKSQRIKSYRRAKQLLIPPAYSLRGIRAYDELQIAVTETRQVKTDGYNRPDIFCT